MSVPVVYLRQATNDIETARDTYEQQQVGLGVRFAEAVRDQVAVICATPKLYGVFRGKIRAASVSGFPHVVYYRDRGTDVLIVAVQHGHRSSQNWIRRKAP
jgi:plasmid stabilization system protein ParE